MKKYFTGKVSAGFVSLVTARTIMMIASGLLGLFLPIFLYNLLGKSFGAVVFYYGFASLVYVLFLSFGVRFADKIGFKNSLRLSMVFLVLFYLFFYLVEDSTIYIYIPLSIVALTLFRTLFWIPFRTDMSKFTNKNNRGRQLSSVEAIRLVLSVILPIAAAWIIATFNYDVLFVIAIILYITAMIPFSFLPKTSEAFSWGYVKTWREFYKRIKKKAMVAHMANGAEGLIGVVVWPIFIFELLKGDFMKVGLISASIVLVTVTLQLLSGKFLDKKLKKSAVLKWGSIFYAIGWIIKISILTAFEVFITGAYHSVAKIFTTTPFDTLTFEMSAEQGIYTDEYSVIIEMATHIGRAMMAVLVFVMLVFAPIKWVFVIAALSALAFNFLATEDLYLKKKKR